MHLCCTYEPCPQQKFGTAVFECSNMVKICNEWFYPGLPQMFFNLTLTSWSSWCVTYMHRTERSKTLLKSVVAEQKYDRGGWRERLQSSRLSAQRSACEGQKLGGPSPSYLAFFPGSFSPPTHKSLGMRLVLTMKWTVLYMNSFCFILTATSTCIGLPKNGTEKKCVTQQCVYMSLYFTHNCCIMQWTLSSPY